MTDVPESHPRYLSLKTRDDIVAGVMKKILRYDDRNGRVVSWRLRAER